MTTKRKKVQLTTPFGRAGWCNLQNPSYKFKTEAGHFSCRVVLPEGTDTDALISRLGELYDEAYANNLAEAQREKSAILEIKRADKPYRRPQDPDTGADLPGYQVTAGLQYKAIGKDETGRKVVLFTKRPIVQDAKKNPVRQEVGSGSLVRMSFSAEPFFTPSVGSGLSLRLIGVQVKELIHPGGGDPGFSEVEGYEEVTTASDPVETTHAPEAAGVEDAGDMKADW